MRETLTFWVTIFTGYLWGIYIILMSQALDGWTYFWATAPISVLIGLFGVDVFKVLLRKKKLTD